MVILLDPRGRVIKFKTLFGEDASSIKEAIEAFYEFHISITFGNGADNRILPTRVELEKELGKKIENVEFVRIVRGLMKDPVIKDRIKRNKLDQQFHNAELSAAIVNIAEKHSYKIIWEGNSKAARCPDRWYIFSQAGEFLARVQC